LPATWPPRSPCFISQGWAPQRRMNGETQSTSIAMLPILLGQIGLPGTNSGAREGDSYGLEAGSAHGRQPRSRWACPIFLWPQRRRRRRLAHGRSRRRARLRQALGHNIKFIWNTQSNTLIIPARRHQPAPSRSSRTRRRSRRSSASTTQMTPSAMFADYVLPDVDAIRRSIDLHGRLLCRGRPELPRSLSRQGRSTSRVGAEAQLGRS
ncbi:MAG: hypothetical protein ACLUNV_04100, partial [Sutterella wadsworthensis]